MAYMNQEKKAKIATELKKVVPKGWKYSLAVRDRRSIEMTISAAPIDLLEAVGQTRASSYCFAIKTKIAEVTEAFEKIFNALNTDNYDRSDIMTDYFDVGHYVQLNIGKWDKPFKLAA